MRETAVVALSAFGVIALLSHWHSRDSLLLARALGCVERRVDDLAKTVALGDHGLEMGQRRGLTIPSQPFRNQKSAPCNANAAEVALNNGCWVKLEVKAPCPSETFEYEGGCYIPVGKGPNEPFSDDRRRDGTSPSFGH
jgi:hypothetical protein